MLVIYVLEFVMLSWGGGFPYSLYLGGMNLERYRHIESMREHIGNAWKHWNNNVDLKIVVHCQQIIVARQGNYKVKMDVNT
jgi:hypothetical protein